MHHFKENKMNKLQMAHQMALMLLKNAPLEEVSNAISTAWQYADAMQAEADKREKEESEKKRADIREMLKANNTFVEREGQHFDDVEWQPDWSQAPEWAGWFSVSKDGSAQWMKSSDGDPYIGGCGSMFFSMGIFKREPCETFNYQGNWQESLRKRPQ